MIRLNELFSAVVTSRPTDSQRRRRRQLQKKGSIFYTFIVTNWFLLAGCCRLPFRTGSMAEWLSGAKCSIGWPSIGNELGMCREVYHRDARLKKKITDLERTEYISIKSNKRSNSTTRRRRKKWLAKFFYEITSTQSDDGNVENRPSGPCFWGEKMESHQLGRCGSEIENVCQLHFFIQNSFYVFGSCLVILHGFRLLKCRSNHLITRVQSVSAELEYPELK